MKGYFFHQRPLVFLLVWVAAAGISAGAAAEVVHLPNGLQVMIVENPGTVSVAADLWVRAGSRNEPPALNGISHFVEHLLFKGTLRRSAPDLSREIASAGGSIGAYTHWEYTRIHLSLLPAHLDLGLDILSDMVQNSLLSPEMIERERKVVLEEISLANIYPPSYVLNLVSRTLFPENPLALPIAGTRDSVQNIKREDLLGYYRRHYVPERAYLTIVGKVNPPEALEAVRRHFSSWPDRGGSIAPAPPPSPQNGFREVRQRKFLDQAIVVLALSAMGRHHADRPAFEIINAVLGSGGQSRLYQEIREKRGLSYLVGSLYHPLADRGIWGTYAGTHPKNVGDLQTILFQQLRRIREEPLGEEELAGVKNYLRGRLLIRTENNGRLSEYLGENLIGGQPKSPRDFLAGLEAVTAEDVIRVARLYLAEDRWNLIILKPYPGLGFFRSLL